jgi:hypothetical protein
MNVLPPNSVNHMAHESRPKSADIDLQLGAAVSDRVQILEVRLLETRAEQKTFDPDLLGRVVTNVHVETHFDKANSRVEVYPRFMLVVQKEGGSPEEVFVRVEARYAISYALESDEGLTRKNFDAFGHRNAVYNVWPYWREFVQSMTSRMALPPLTLPVFRLGVSRFEHDAGGLPRPHIKQLRGPEAKGEGVTE